MNFEDNLNKINNEIKHHGYILVEESSVQTITTSINVVYKKWCVRIDHDKLIYYDLIGCRNCSWIFRGISPIPRPENNWWVHCIDHTLECNETLQSK